MGQLGAWHRTRQRWKRMGEGEGRSKKVEVEVEVEGEGEMKAEGEVEVEVEMEVEGAVARLGSKYFRHHGRLQIWCRRSRR